MKKEETKEKQEKAKRKLEQRNIKREFDPGSGRTLAACLTHASRTRFTASLKPWTINLKRLALRKKKVGRSEKESKKMNVKVRNESLHAHISLPIQKHISRFWWSGKSSGGRVSNAWTICPIQRNSLGKPGLKPYNTLMPHGIEVKLRKRYRMSSCLIS